MTEKSDTTFQMTPLFLYDTISTPELTEEILYLKQHSNTLVPDKDMFAHFSKTSAFD